MNTQKQHELLLKHFGRVPEHYTLYPLPDDKRGSQEYACIGMTIETGEVLLFEFDFTVPGRFCLPWECLENSIPHHCKTCEWNLWRGKGTSYCTETEKSAAASVQIGTFRPLPSEPRRLSITSSCTKNTMERLVYPCDGCALAGAYDCKRCPRWRRWYFHRQAQINAFVARLDRYWVYDLPLRRIGRKG